MTKEYNLIYTDNYVLAVSDEEIKEDDVYVSWETDYSLPKYIVYCMSSGLNGNNPKKIVAHLPLNSNSPYSSVIPLLPPLPIEDDVYDSLVVPSINKGDGMEQAMFNDGYYAGYNKAKEKYKWTDEDLSNVINAAFGLDLNTGIWYSPKTFSKDEIIRLIQQPKRPTKFICEMENYCGSPFTTERCPKCVDSCDKAYLRSKTTSTPNGEQWVGEWVY
jgi:hypothetical protein